MKISDLIQTFKIFLHELLFQPISNLASTLDETLSLDYVGQIGGATAAA